MSDAPAGDPVRRITSWLRAHPLPADALLTALLLAMSVAFGVFYSEVGPSEREAGLFSWTLIVVMTLPIVWRRRAPVLVAWVVVAVTMVYWVLDFPDEPSGVGLVVAFYGLGAHEDRPRSLRHFWGVYSVVLGVMVAGLISPSEELPWLALPTTIIIFATAYILGDNLRTRRNYLLELKEKAARAEAERAAEAQRAVNEERTRIARELHDVVAHSMSVMVVQAGAARRVMARDPARAESAMATIESTGRESLHEMRRVLGVLRGDDDRAEMAPAPGLDDFGRLLKHCEEAGLPVELEVRGEVRQLAPGLELSAYRVVQESLTNSLKHAGPAQAVVKLDYRDQALVVEVTDNGYGAATVSGSGQGLVGMRERVEAYGGDLVAGPKGGGGYGVVATFPIRVAR